MAPNQPPNTQRPEGVSAWAPLRRSVFRALWIATLVSNVGTWMQNAAAAWLMTSLSSSPTMISLVQTATSLPLFLLSVPSGALADVMDRRVLILVTQIWMLLAAAALGALTVMGLTTPWMLLALTLILGIGAALQAPAWQAIVPELVPRAELHAAVALNSAGFNAARAFGPALGGFAVLAGGPGAAFLFNAVSFLGVVFVIFFWNRPKDESTLPTEHIMGAMRAGIRYVRYAPLLTSITIRSGVFTLCAVSILALLPVLARQELGLGSLGYGVLLGCFGGGAVVATAALPAMRRRMSLDALTAIGTLLYAACLAVLGYVLLTPISCVALVLAGAAWLALLSSFNAYVQAVAPAWVRGRALAVYMLVLFGAMAGGSALWGAVASYFSYSTSLAASAVGLIAALPLAIPFRLRAIESMDLTPSKHWPDPTVVVQPGPDDGPVLVTVDYRIDPERAEEFLQAIHQLRRTRLRDGAYRWELFADAADPARYVEHFLLKSWIEHLRQHTRATVADREIEERVYSFHLGGGRPHVMHFLPGQAHRR